MKILCFGTFAEVLRVCCRGYVPGSKRQRNEIVPQAKLVGELLNAIDMAYGKDWTVGDNSQQLTRELLKCEQHIPDELKPAAAEVTASLLRSQKVIELSKDEPLFGRSWNSDDDAE